MLSRFEEIFRKLLKNKYILYVPVAAMLLVSLGVLFKKTPEEEKTEATPAVLPQKDLERELEDILSGVSGVRRADVLLAYAGGTEYVLAQDVSERTDGDRTETDRKTVVAGGQTVTVGTVCPRIVGAVVVYTGEKSAYVKLDLYEAVEAATGLSADKITVLCGG